MSFETNKDKTNEDDKVVSDEEDQCNFDINKEKDKVITNEDNAKTSCEKLQKELEEINSQTQIKLAEIKGNSATGIIDSIGKLNPINGVVNMVNNITTKLPTDIRTSVITSLNTVVKDITNNQITNKCKAAFTNSQLNIIDTSRCLQVSTNACKSITNETIRNECINNALKNNSVSNIKLKNEFIGEQNCIFNNTLNEISKKTNNIHLQEILKKIQESQNSNKPVTSSTLICTNINTDISSETFNKQVACCNSQINNIQRNEILCGGATNIDLNNKSTIFQNCFNALETTSNNTTDNTTQVKKEVMERVSNDETSNIWLYIVITIIVIICLCIGAFLVWKWWKKNGTQIEEKFLRI